MYRVLYLNWDYEPCYSTCTFTPRPLEECINSADNGNRMNSHLRYFVVSEEEFRSYWEPRIL